MRALIVALALGVVQGGAQSPTAADVQRAFQNPPDDSRIMMRWWWFGPSATRDQIDVELRRMREGGIGGFEIATVYPLALDDPSRGFHNYAYLSPEHLEAIAHTARRARELGLRMDVTIGSGWSYGGPYITPDLASVRLRSDRREIAPSLTRIARPVPFENDRLVAAFVGRGSVQEVDPSTYEELTIPADGPLTLPRGDGPRVLLFYFAGQTGQVVKRAAVGADGYVLDHYSRPAIEKHLQEAGEKILSAAGPRAIDSIFCDSLEVYDADWTPDLLVEFQRRRGYDLRPLLPLAEFGRGERADAIRRDYGRTLTELFEDRFLIPMHEWAAKKGVRFRIQNYGVPPAALASARHADIVDGEGFEWRTLSTARWASSAAHLFGKAVVSSEAWTWLHSPAFRATPLDLKAEGDLHFLSGINQLIGHGWPYSPPQAGAPGWMFYAAGVYSDKNPWWPVMADTSRYLQRVSAVLRQGEPFADVAVYAPTEDVWAQFRPGSPAALNLAAGIREALGSATIPVILDSGHTFDLIDSRTLDEAGRRRYRLLVLPQSRFIPDSAREWILRYASAGGKVVRVSADGDLAARIGAAIPADVAFEPRTPAIGFVHRRLRDGDVYFVANTTNEPLSVIARFGSTYSTAEVWDPMTGNVEAAARVEQGLALAFEPYGSRLVVFRADAGSARSATLRRAVGSQPIGSGWTLTLDGARQEGVIDLPYSWADRPRTRFVSGTASFVRTVDVPAAYREQGVRVALDFGAATAVARESLPGGTMRGNSFAALLAPPIREAATVFVNGQRVGAVWAPPYRIDITDRLRPGAGANDLRIDVYNTAINMLAEGGRLPDVDRLVATYGQRFRLQDLDNLSPIPSGILSVPRLVAER